MLAPDVEIAGLDGRHLAGWLTLATPPGAAEGWALAILEAGAPVSVLVSGRGAVDPSELPAWHEPIPRALRTLRRHLGVGFCAAVEARAVPEIVAEAEIGIGLGDDYPAQALAIWRAVERAAGESVWLDPPLLELLPALSAEPLQTTFDLLVPDGSSVVAYVFEDDERSALCSVIAEKRGGDLVRVACHRAIADRLSEAELARSWRPSVPRLLDTVAERFAPASLGVFASRGAIERVIAGPAGQLGRELRAGNIVLSPAPLWLVGLVGGAAAMGLATRGARTALRFLPASARHAASHVARGAQDRLRASGANPFGALGFDPLELLADLRELYRGRA